MNKQSIDCLSVFKFKFILHLDFIADSSSLSLIVITAPLEFREIIYITNKF